jgi:hypothetical protein
MGCILDEAGEEFPSCTVSRNESLGLHFIHARFKFDDLIGCSVGWQNLGVVEPTVIAGVIIAVHP